MKLSDMNTTPNRKALNKITESRFGFQIDYSALTTKKAKALLSSINETVSKIRLSSSIHTAEQNPKYLGMLMMREGLNSWLADQKVLTEGEVGQAETILAAKNMVDSVQDMIEKIGKMQNEQLPALLDSIRDQIGNSQADVFKNGVGQVLADIATQLSSARETLDQNARSLAGEEMPTDMGVTEPEGEDEDEFGSEEEPDGFDATDAAAGGTEPMGRGLR